MTKKEYLRFIQKEVYGEKKLSMRQRRHKRLHNPSTNAVYLLRTYQYHSSQKGVLHSFLAAHANRKLVRRYNIYIGAQTRIGMGLSLPHPTGIVIGKKAILGENCTVYQHVTLGSRQKGDWKLGLQPHVGNDCTLFAGCVLLGHITLSDGTTVGANAVMTHSSEPGTVWAGVPAVQIGGGRS